MTYRKQAGRFYAANYDTDDRLEEGWGIIRNDGEVTGGQDELVAVVDTETMADALLALLGRQASIAASEEPSHCNCGHELFTCGGCRKSYCPDCGGNRHLCISCCLDKRGI